MKFELPPPDGHISDGTPLKMCPSCGELKRLEAFGQRNGNGIYPGEGVYHKQSWCSESL